MFTVPSSEAPTIKESSPPPAPPPPPAAPRVFAVHAPALAKPEIDPRALYAPGEALGELAAGTRRGRVNLTGLPLVPLTPSWKTVLAGLTTTWWSMAAWFLPLAGLTFGWMVLVWTLMSDADANMAALTARMEWMEIAAHTLKWSVYVAGACVLGSFVGQCLGIAIPTESRAKKMVIASVSTMGLSLVSFGIAQISLHWGDGELMVPLEIAGAALFILGTVLHLLYLKAVAEFFRMPAVGRTAKSVAVAVVVVVAVSFFGTEMITRLIRKGGRGAGVVAMLVLLGLIALGGWAGITAGMMKVLRALRTAVWNAWVAAYGLPVDSVEVVEEPQAVKPAEPPVSSEKPPA